jgi:uncharacterized membrane protein
LKLFQLLKNASNSVFKFIWAGMEGIGDAEERLWATPVDRKPIMWVSHARSFLKAISWRFFGNLISWIIIYELTHKAKLAFIASGIELVVKIVLYYAHERVWNKVKWGRE